MQLIQSRLKKVDIYAVDSEESAYIGSKPVPALLGFVYADIQQIKSNTSEERAGKREKKSLRLILRKDAGVKCGDLAGIYADAPDFEITEVKQFSDHISATAVAL